MRRLVHSGQAGTGPSAARSRSGSHDRGTQQPRWSQGAAAGRPLPLDVAAESLRRAQARAFARRLPVGGVAIDLDGTAARFSGDLGPAVVAIGSAAPRLGRLRPVVRCVAGSPAALPLAPQSAAGAWADSGLIGLDGDHVPLVLGEVHRVLRVGAPVDLRLPAPSGDVAGAARPGSDHRAAGTSRTAGPDLLALLLAGAGFELVAGQPVRDGWRVRAERLDTVADIVAPGLRLLVVGLNPSTAAAAAGIAFSRPGDRFWSSAVAAGVVCRPLDPRHALESHGVGMTDIVKRSTVGASELTPAEYRQGMRRVESLVGWCQPRLVCFVGLSGWRAAVDREAKPGLQVHRLAGRPCYIMPSTSGANAQAHADHLADHLRTAADLADRS